jgi:protein involved in polysaccharide export with SLBB domain
MQSPRFNFALCMSTLYEHFVFHHPIKDAFAQADNDCDYQLYVDNPISVSIFNISDLTIENDKISTAGRISMSLIGRVNVKGLTVTPLENNLVRLYLKGYLKNRYDRHHH